MSKVVLPRITSGYNVTKLNDAIDILETTLNEEVLFRVNPAGEINQMENNLDMNGYRILNLPKPICDLEPVRLVDLIDTALDCGNLDLVLYKERQTLTSGQTIVVLQELDSTVGIVVEVCSSDKADAGLLCGYTKLTDKSIELDESYPEGTEILITKGKIVSQGTTVTSSDYVTNESNVTGATITDALNVINAMPTPMVFKGGLNLATGDSALPVSPQNGWSYLVTTGGNVTVTKDGTAPVLQIAQVNDSLIYDSTLGYWWLFDAAGTAIQPTKEVTSPYTLQGQDTGIFIIFNEVGSATLNIPDGLQVGTSVAATNIGGGDVLLVNTGTDTIRGATTLGDVSGYLAATKITNTVWQSSERA
jgi:hypothetical protein